MIEEFWEFNPVRFYTSYNGYMHRLHLLQQEKELAVYSGGTGYEQPHVYVKRGDPTTRIVLKRMSLDGRIKAMEEYFELESNVRKFLSSEEILMADYLISINDEKNFDINEICDMLHLSESQARKKYAGFITHVMRLCEWKTEKSGD